MTKLEAIWASVEHWLDLWERVAAGEVLIKRDIQSNKCACCEYIALASHNESRSPSACDGCPVKEYVGMSRCSGTPWASVGTQIDEIKRIENDNGSILNGDIELLLDLVEDEYQFLVDVALSRTVLCGTP